MAVNANSTPVPNWTRRFDLSDEFTGLATEITALRHLSYIAEELATDVLRQTNMDLGIVEMQRQGYTVAVMTKDQFKALDFLIGHVGDVARRAEEKMLSLETLALDYVKSPACA